MNDHISKIKAALGNLGPGPWKQDGSFLVNLYGAVARIEFQTQMDYLVLLLNSAAALVAEHEATPRTERRVGPWTRRVEEHINGRLNRAELDERNNGTYRHCILERRRANPYQGQRDYFCHICSDKRDAAIAERDKARKERDSLSGQESYYLQVLKDVEADRNRLRAELEAETNRREEAIEKAERTRQSYSELLDTYTQIQHRLLAETSLRKDAEKCSEFFRTGFDEQTTCADKFKAAAKLLHETFKARGWDLTGREYEDALAYEQSITQPDDDRVQSERRGERDLYGRRLDCGCGRRDYGVRRTKVGTKADRKNI